MVGMLSVSEIMTNCLAVSYDTWPGAATVSTYGCEDLAVPHTNQTAYDHICIMYYIVVFASETARSRETALNHQLHGLIKNAIT